MDLFGALSNRPREVRRLLELAVTWPVAVPRQRTAPPKQLRSCIQLRPDEVDRLVVDYRGGATVKPLAAKYRVDVTTVRKHLKARGVDLRPSTLTPKQVEAAAELYAQGWSLRKIAQRYQTTDETVRRHLRRLGVVMRKPSERSTPLGERR